ncbi:hypothetical protein CXB51_002640 [Gossypium anomalum]|uniref:RNase H type-1 domain-containing protein n=1 Tax=Gossypium anomalum TaxID=47600 RepID=A0A8J6D6S7_9ROSI|nr:hypothetical protein CXB51_002640 [Gossypium anomalum]
MWSGRNTCSSIPRECLHKIGPVGSRSNILMDKYKPRMEALVSTGNRKLKYSKCTKLDISYWVIWYNRNKIYHEGIRDNIMDTVVFINAYSLEIQQVGESTILTPTQVCDRWEPPEDNIVKVNFDATDQQNLNKVVSGIIIRNSEGLVMASCIYQRLNVTSLTMAKMRACLQVVVFADELGF